MSQKRNSRVAISGLTGQAEPPPLITHRFELAQWREAFQTLETMEAIKPVLRIPAVAKVKP